MQQSIAPAGIAPISLDNGLFLDGEAERDSLGKYIQNSQRGWEQRYAGTGKRLPSVGEILHGIRLLDQKKDQALQGIVDDLQEDWLCAGKLNYDESKLPTDSGYLDVLVKDSAWRRALEDELFQYDAPETVDMLQRVSGKRPYICTPDAKERKIRPEIAVWLFIDTVGFSLGCNYDPIYSYGRARGVRGAGISEQEAPRGAIAEPKLLSPPATINRNDYEKQLELQSVYNPVELEYARQLLNGTPNGTVMDWKRR